MGEERGLIKNKEMEELQIRLRNIKQEAFAAKKDAKLAESREDFVECFLKLCKKSEGLKKEQIINLNSKQLCLLTDLLIKKTFLRRSLEKALCLIPVLGILAIPEYKINELPAWKLCRLRKKFRKMYGEDYFPCNEFKSFSRVIL